ncbi:MDN1 midasin, partial [Cryptosporidium felis]
MITSINNNENILLVGDTGTGKTTIIQQLHGMLYGGGRSFVWDSSEEAGEKECDLLVYNFNEQSESSDIIGSFRPVNTFSELKLLYDDYLVLLEKSNISRKKNEAVIRYLLQLLKEKKWAKFIDNMLVIIDKLLVEFDKILKSHDGNNAKPLTNSSVNKDHKKNAGTECVQGESRPKREESKKRAAVSVEDVWTLKLYWRELRQKCQMKLRDERISSSQNEKQKHYFEFLDGILLKAVREGHWLILDE